MRKEEQNINDVDAEYLDMMVFNFNYAIDNTLPSVYMGFVIIDDDNLKEYWVKKKDWLQTVDILIEGAIEIEEYEYCSQLKTIKEKL